MARLLVRLAWIVSAFALLGLAYAQAALRVEPPAGWSTSVPVPARARAEQWAARGGSVVSVYSPVSRDRYAETLAVLAFSDPLDPDDLATDARGREALARIGARILDTSAELDAFERVELAGTALLRGRWQVPAGVAYLALVPTGPTHAAVVMQIESRTDVLYAEVFDNAIAELSGVAPPIVPFPRGTWLTVAWIGWVVAIAAGVAYMVRFAPPTPGPAVTGRRIAVGLLGATVLVGIGAWVAGAAHPAELALVERSPAWLAVEVSAGGLVGTLVVFVLGNQLERRIGFVASAPTVGAYASRPAPGTSPPGALDHLQLAGPPDPRPAPVADPARPLVEIPPPPTERPPAITGNTAVGPAPRPPPAPRRGGPVPSASDDAATVVAPRPSSPPKPSGFPAPGRGVADLMLDEPSAKLEPVHDGAPEEAASLETARIRVDRPAGRGGRFRGQ